MVKHCGCTCFVREPWHMYRVLHPRLIRLILFTQVHLWILFCTLLYFPSFFFFFFLHLTKHSPIYFLHFIIFLSIFTSPFSPHFLHFTILFVLSYLQSLPHFLTFHIFTYFLCTPLYFFALHFSFPFYFNFTLYPEYFFFISQYCSLMFLNFSTFFCTSLHHCPPFLNFIIFF